MSELQQVIDEIAGQLAHMPQCGSYSVMLDQDEAQQLIDAAQLMAPLQERCELLGRALAAIWSLVDEEYQREIMSVLDAPTADGKTLPASTLVELLERKDAMMAEEV